MNCPTAHIGAVLSHAKHPQPLVDSTLFYFGRKHQLIGDIPPAEYEAAYYEQQNGQAEAA